MRGSIKRRGQGWRIIADTGRDPSTGRRKRHTATFRTKREAEAALTGIIEQANTGAYVAPAKLTVGDFLRRWQRDYVASNTRPRTAEEYAKKINTHIIPAIGAIPLAGLRPDHLQAFYRKSLESGRRDGKGGLSARSVVHLHRIIREALGHAVRWGLLARNVALAVDPPRPVNREMATLDAEGVRRVLDACEGTIWHVAFHLAIYTGLRRSELLGLRWKDVDLVLGTLSVVQAMHQLRGGRIIFTEPKTAKGKRMVALVPATAVLLRAHRERQEADRELLGAVLGPEDLVLAHADSSPMTPYSMTQAWARLAARTNVRNVRLHDLRHTHATLMLKQGVHPKIVSERLGHANIAITLDTYSHVLPGLQEEAARRFAEALDQPSLQAAS